LLSGSYRVLKRWGGRQRFATRSTRFHRAVCRSSTDGFVGARPTYQYFGNPIYIYSLRQGIEDGFLAPFEVIRARLDRDIDGVEILAGVYDRACQLVPAGTYGPPQFERKLILPERTREVARYVSEFLRRSGETGKTIVFCQDQDHAARMREELVNLNSDLLQIYGDEWVVRITSNERDRERLLDDFARENSQLPVVAVTSQPLSTGVDVPTARTIVLFRRIESMIEFKQIIGRGTRLSPEFGKEYFTVIDFTGATRKFEDPDFDGPPVRETEAQDSGDGEPDVPDPLDLNGTEGELEDDGSDVIEVADAEQDYEEQHSGEFPEVSDVSDTTPVADPDDFDAITRRSEKHTVDGYDVYVTSEQLFVMDVYNDRLRPVRYQQWVRDRVLALHRGPAGLLQQWATARGRKELRELLRDTLCFEIDELAARLRRPDCDPIDLLIYLGWEWPLHTRAERVAAFNATERDYLDSYSPRARQVLTTLLEKYTAHGVDDLSAGALQSPPLNELGSVVELAADFGGPRQMHAAIDALSQRLFGAS
jgi:type I restriction enzyme, R subunit